MHRLFLLTAFDIFTAFLRTTSKLNGLDCHYFDGPPIEDSETIGLWNLIHFRSNTMNGTANEKQCLEISYANEEDVRVLRSRVEKFVEKSMNWNSIKLRMTIPCRDIPYRRKRYYYLQRVPGNGAYRTMPLPTEEIYDNRNLHRNYLRLQAIPDKYMIMVDCDMGYMFVVGREPPTGSEVERQLPRLLEDYWNN